MRRATSLPLYWAAVTVSEGLLAMGANAGNAFAEAPPPDKPFSMQIDDQLAGWWVEHLGNPPIPSGYVLPVNHALHPVLFYCKICTVNFSTALGSSVPNVDNNIKVYNICVILVYDI